DTALALHLAGESEPRGAHLENLVLLDLLAWRELVTPRPGILYWRTADGAEVDFVIETPRRLLPIEVKTSMRALPADACVASIGLGESERALLDYFIGLRTQRLEVHGTSTCPFLLVQVHETASAPADAACEAIWVGARPGHDTSSLALYRCSGGRAPTYDAARAIRR
ncbi:MAG: DUF4143 domain-containing protein, partial [Burkholderiaceae bacterium]